MTARPAGQGSPAELAAIGTEGLRKTYKSSRGDVEAVRGIGLNVLQGEFFGLLGPNGAGKSTTIGMLTTRVIPTSGQASVDGHDAVKHPALARTRLAVVTQVAALDRSLSVFENLYFHGRYFCL